ncbi:MAG: TIGR04211 family SH3 domain-containing protein [Desulfobulbaceae bacterium]|nr:TIGR04211 family SH3 domain-containing protein [Desulfobulbaceae bacterium]
MLTSLTPQVKSLSTKALLPLLSGLILQGALLVPTAVQAEKLFVKPSSEVVVRTGQGTDYKIIAMVKDGASVEFLEEENSYTKVRLKNGVEGWMLKRFLSSEPPLTEIVETLRGENQAVKEMELQATQKLDEVSSSLEETKSQLETLLAERDKLNNTYQTLLSDTADVVKIKQQQQTTSEENKNLIDKLTLAEEENETLKKDKTMHWFLAGAGVLLLGILLGKMPGPSRRRKSSLM